VMPLWMTIAVFIKVAGCEQFTVTWAASSWPGRRRSQQRHEQPGEQDRREIVNGEPQLVAVRADLPPFARRAEADRRVVHQHVKPRHCCRDPGRQVPHVAERGQVSSKAPDTLAAQLGAKVSHPGRIASVRQHLPAGVRQLPGQVTAEPGGRAGDKHGRRHVSHLASSISCVDQ
jgi:hypothetical protein